ncbi:PREDICTED: caspase recruitment domain-containing protein 6 [Chrysochloris asiatica]|uniref:Caspase recruitment domain-containing protein 6 n=1 Tax=Chrysochloris asiatica TaxID=185453 RepID=A0A9B0U8L1_CHRAS|nr:PREDICTED: caspase recruitment domain-containing protein 6 [Chrysochloris asiatica]
MATNTVPSEIIERERKKLLEILHQDPDSILDTLMSRRLISEKEYETLDKVTDPLKKSRKLLILVQRKGEVSCQHFLKCFLTTFPESAATCNLSLKHEILKHETTEPFQSTGMGKNSEDAFFYETKQPENHEVTVSFQEKRQLDLETSEYLGDKKISDRETALSSKEDEKEYDTAKDTFSHAIEDVNYEVPSTVAYLRDGQRYEESDDSLYLGEEEYLGSVEYPENAETTDKEECYDHLEHVEYDGEEDSEYSEIPEFSGNEQNYEDSQTHMILEEEEEKSIEERKKVFKDVLSYLNLNRSRKLLPDLVKQFSLNHEYKWTPENPGDLVWDFLMKVQALDVTARDSIVRHRVLSEDCEGELLTEMENLELRDIQSINPLDVLCATMLCSHSSLQCELMSNMYLCHFALPLLLPDAENNRSILMLGAMKDIVKQQSVQRSGGPAKDTEDFLAHIKMPVISFVRLQSCSFSKTRILNKLLNTAQMRSHKIFLHQDSPVLVPPRQISDGLVEITWCFPDGDSLKENSSFIQKSIAVANLRGDLESFWTQFGFLMEVSSAVFFFSDYLGEKEWNLLRFLGKGTIERCYFVLSPQARENEEAHIFQRILELKPSQILFLEGEEAEDEGKDMGCLQVALQEVMCSEPRYVSVEDMAFLARELGIQVDQDYEDTQGIQVSPGENMTGTAESERKQRHSQPKSPAQMPTREPGAICQNPQNIYSVPGFMPPPQISSPLLPRIGGNFNQASLRPPWLMGSHFWLEQRCKWVRPLVFHNTRAHSQGKGFGLQYFQPQRFYSGERFMKFSTTGMFERQPRPIFKHIQAWPERPKPMGAFGSQLPGGVRKPHPGPPRARGTRQSAATGNHMRTTSCIKDPHHQAFQPTGTPQKSIRSVSQQRSQDRTQRRPSDPAFQTKSHPMSTNFQPKSSQPKYSQPKPSQHAYSQSNPTQSKTSQPKDPQSKPTQSQASQHKAPQSLPSQPKCTQFKSHQPRPSQPKASQARSSQAKVCHSRVSSRK